MPSSRRIAFLTLPEGIDLRQRETLRGITRYARERGDWHVALDPYADRPGPSRYDGLIAMTRKGRGPRLASAPVPVVVVTWGHMHQPRLVRVIENRYAAGRVAAEHLIERGCRTFAYIGFARQRQSSAEREEFAHQLRRRGLEPHRARTFVTYASSSGSWRKVMRSLGSWLARLARPAGIYVARPDFARAVADLALARGLRIPDDIALVAGDDDPVLCGLPPELTAVRFDYAELGQRAAELLDHLIGGGRPPERNTLIQPTLVPRLSTDRLTVADALVTEALVWIDRRCTERFDWRTLDTGESDRIGPQHVADAVGVPLRRLEKRFRRARRGTVLGELTLARLEFAKGQLIYSDSTVPAVAHESGFGSYPSFLRAFRQHVGIAPAAWRRQHASTPHHDGAADERG